MKHDRFCQKIGLEEGTPWYRIDWDEVDLRKVELDDVDYGMKLVRRLLPKKGLSETVKGARRFIALVIAGSGDYCPVCGKWAKINAHGLGGAHARALLYIMNAASIDRKWVNCLDKKHPKWLTKTNQHQIMERWGLLERRSREGEKKGHWRHTKLGRSFVLGRVEVPARVFTYSGRTVGFSIEQVQCSDVKSRSFNYTEHMKDTWMGELLERKRRRKKKKKGRHEKSA